MEALLACLLILLGLVAFFNHCHKETIMVENEEMRKRLKEYDSYRQEKDLQNAHLRAMIDNYEQVTREYDKTIEMLLAKDASDLKDPSPMLDKTKVKVQLAILNEFKATIYHN